MSIYVDDLMPQVPKPNWPYRWSCHLFADDVNELHEFAARIGMKRAWFQNNPRLPHYDLTKTRRAQAVKAGAIEVGRRFVGERIRAARLATTSPIGAREGE